MRDVGLQDDCCGWKGYCNCSSCEQARYEIDRLSDHYYIPEDDDE